MKRSLHLSFFACAFCAALGWSQTAPSPAPAPGSPTSSPTASTGLKPRGPEAVAQQDPNRVVATIAGKPITAKQAEELMKPLPPQERKRYDSNLQSLLQQLYMEQQIADQAAKMSLDQQSPWKEQLELARANILTQAYVDKMASGSSTAAADPKQYYDAHAADFDQSKISGIVIAFSPPGTPASSSSPPRTEAQAQDKANDIEKKLKSGGDLATLARTESDNQQSAAQGGALGSFLSGDKNVPADIKNAVMKLQPGQISEPIRANGAFFIIKLDSRAKVPFEQVRAGIVQQQQNEKTQNVLNAERDKYKVQVQDPDFFNVSSATGPKIPSLQRPPTPGTPSAGATKPPAQ